MNTSVRGRGKWGDFLVALIPVSWCCNILINSNFILRMIEWQNESSLFTIRIQGKQWYWVYKYDPNTAQAVMGTPKNLGNNRWRVISGQESYNADTYYQAIHLAAHIQFQDSYSKFTKKIDTHRKGLLSLSLTNEKTKITSNWTDTVTSDSRPNFTEEQIKDVEYQPYMSLPFMTNKREWVEPTNITKFDNNINLESLLTVQSTIKKKRVNKFYKNDNISLYEIYSNDPIYFKSMFLKQFTDNCYNSYYDFLQLDETSDSDSNSRHLLTTQPFRLMRGILNQHTVDILQDSNFSSNNLNKLLFLNTKFLQTGEALADKELMPETLWGFRQKKYKRTKKFKFKPEVTYDPLTFTISGEKKSPANPRVDISGIDLYTTSLSYTASLGNSDVSLKDRIRDTADKFNYRISTRINRHRSELVPVTLARRLLRTKRTLVLPAHVNLTLITNSYDVVHSWFVPGLGLKVDCVPGRSTHHTFYIDNIGFYYGQCAEICGRYHHHMPIRLCALPFEHFVVWWQSKGAARMNRTSEINNNKYIQHSFNNAVTRDKIVYRMN